MYPEVLQNDVVQDVCEADTLQVQTYNPVNTLSMLPSRLPHSAALLSEPHTLAQT